MDSLSPVFARSSIFCSLYFVYVWIVLGDRFEFPCYYITNMEILAIEEMLL